MSSPMDYSQQQRVSFLGGGGGGGGAGATRSDAASLRDIPAITSSSSSKAPIARQHAGRDMSLRDPNASLAQHHAERPHSLSPVPAVTRNPYARHKRTNTDPTGADNNNMLLGDLSENELVVGVITPPSAAIAVNTGAATAADQVQQQQRPTKRSNRKGRISVAVRKRPVESEGGEDCISIGDPSQVHVRAPKLRIDLTEYVESHEYEFDHSFDDTASNAHVYATCAKPLLDVVFKGGSASCFAYGQTGSGKTHTMIGTDADPGLYVLASRDIFDRLPPTQRVYVSLYEIYCNSLFDLLNKRQVVIAREDANKRVNVCGLTWHEVDSVQSLVQAIDTGTDQRRTGSTSANEFSSRSHAVMSITVRDDTSPRYYGCLNIVDLAGSERAVDTSSNDRQTRLEGAEINKSLLALKECIRGLDEKRKHIPFRGSKLTEVLRDSFVGSSRTVMIATISPNQVNVEHTLNTLRYAYRVKGLTTESIVPSKERNAPRLDRVVAMKRPDRLGAGEDDIFDNQAAGGGGGGGGGGGDLMMMMDDQPAGGGGRRQTSRPDRNRNSNNNNNANNTNSIAAAAAAGAGGGGGGGGAAERQQQRSNNRQQQHPQARGHSESPVAGGSPPGGRSSSKEAVAAVEARMNNQIKEQVTLEPHERNHAVVAGLFKGKPKSS